MIKQEEVFKVGRFAKPHGIKGELSLQTASDLFDGEDDVPYVICALFRGRAALQVGLCGLAEVGGR